jgi:hypothetical protein
VIYKKPGYVPFKLESTDRIIRFDLLLEAFENSQMETLREYYRRPDIAWVRKMMKEILENPSQIDVIANKYNVEFEDGGDSPLLVTTAVYRKSDGKFHLWMSNNAIDLMKTNSGLDPLVREIELFIEHEDTHRQQDQLKNSEQPCVNSMDAQKWESVKKYLSQYQEIPAFARYVARDIFMNGADESNISNLKNLKMSQMSKVIVNNYFKIGGETLKKFLKEIYAWFTEPRVGTGDEYRKWLKKHQFVGNKITGIDS